MSKIALTPNASGTGTLSIVAPNTNTDRTLTLPDASDTLMGQSTPVTQSQLATALNASGSAPLYAARAWVNFNGTGTVAIRASGNVSSITDFGTGHYGANFITPMLNADYAVVATAGSNGSGPAIDACNYFSNLNSTTVCRVTAYQPNTISAVDAPVVSVSVFG